ncbi:hydrogenase maturation protease [Calditrichota bacterium GD2]
MMKIIGLGNRLRGDDGIGPVVLDSLKKKDIPIPLQFIEAGSDAFTLLEHLNASEPMIIVDCADMGFEPGTVKVFDVNDHFAMQHDFISLHGFSFAEVLSLAQAMGPIAPCKIIGVQPATIEFGQPISRAVNKALPEILNLIIEEAQAYAEENLNH